MTASIFMVALNDTNPGSETILGFYPTRELAEARKARVEQDPDYFAYGDIDANETDTNVFIQEFRDVATTGVDTSFCLR
jgi:hypothetical protein